MNWRASARRRLPEHLDARGDLASPWARFPTYERYTIGWRMGTGEDWLGLWGIFLDDLPRDRSTRLAYLRRHPPAPLNWSESVYRVLHPDWPGDDEDDEDEDDEAPDPTQLRRAELRAAGLVKPDASYGIWRAMQDGVHWPWQDCPSPRVAGRHWTRDLWFWSRHVAELRAAGTLVVPKVPWAWRGCRAAIETGEPGRLRLRHGLLTLVRLLCAGEVIPPWRLGLDPADFADTFDDDMGYVDAWRLWTMSVVDDAEVLRRFGQTDTAPPAWRAWIEAQVYIG